MNATRTAALFTFLLAAFALADGPKDNLPDKVRPIPPEGIKLQPKDAEELKVKVVELGKAIAALPKKLKGKPALLELIPDVEVFHKAVRYALEMDQFYSPRDVALARKQLEQGLQRASELAAGKPTWIAQTGLVVRGFRSRIDGSVQPYGLVVPPQYRPGGRSHRLDVWLHGRGEKSGEVQFIAQAQRNPGRFVPRDAFVLHPYGRYCNAFKFAGEEDVFEAINHARKHYAIDDDRVVMRGFSMGGAGCWQFAVHYPGLWCAAAPGAGFSETKEFLRVFQNEKVSPPDYEQKLWAMYDCDLYAANLFNLPTVAYSGEKDRQKQAADVMETALKEQGIDMVHVLGACAGHTYTPKAMAEINRRIDRIAQTGRNRVPQKVVFTTHTLRYNKSHWVAIDGMERHWAPAKVSAEFAEGGKQIAVKTDGVTALTLSFQPGDCPASLGVSPAVVIDGKKVESAPLRSDRSWSASFHREGGEWKLGIASGLSRHGLQGPIDDAFLSRFIIVKPTGKPANDKVGEWTKAEMERAVKEWKRHFRGDAIVKDDKDVTEADARSSNLILWGDPSSNGVLKKLIDRLPVGWDAKRVTLGGKAFDAATHVPLMIYPNPVNPDRYVVLNSGFTFREYDYLNNARQVPKLPDYAVVDVTTKPSSRYPGKVVAAGFFDELWKLPGGKSGRP